MNVDDPVTHLVNRARRHDAEAFDRLLSFSLPLSRALVTRMLADTAEVDDVLQEACLQAWLGLDGLQRPERFRQWLAGIALNLARMHLRAQRPQLLLETEWGDGSRSIESVIETGESLRALDQALGELPESARATVAAFYLEGRSLPEISANTGTPIGTLKARLSRARHTLRSALAAKEPGASGGTGMIEVTVQSVLTQEPPTDPGNPSRVLILAAKDGARVLPIWIGKADGDFLALQLSGQALPRPLTLNLLAQILDLTGTSLHRIAINRLRDEVFYATLSLTVAGQPQTVDARPSDAVNLALLKGVPIFVSPEILESQGILSDTLHAHLTAGLKPVSTEPVSWMPAVPPEWPPRR